MGLTATGHLEHLHYGAKIRVENEKQAQFMVGRTAFISGNAITYDHAHENFTLEECPLEFGSLGKGDVREPLVEIVCADGSRSADFIYDSCEIVEGEAEARTLPTAYGNATTLILKLADKASKLKLLLYYTTFEECDVIARRSVLVNEGEEPVKIERLLSLSMDIPGRGYVISSFTGAWAREMHRDTIPLKAGKFVMESRCGVSSNRTNPFFIVSKPGTNESAGECLGFNLIYSGDHYEMCEVGTYNSTRIATGINPTGFEWTLGAGEEFESPQAVFTFSNSGYNLMSQRMHGFVKKHIVRGSWRDKQRPVLINNWEATYFDLSEKKLMALARRAAKLGIELFVMDDGWFGKRNDEKSSLGDWYVNKEKLPNGLSGLSDKINALGLDFGIWVEPEMISVDSDLYRAHPDWAMDVPGRDHSEGRNQRFLDLANDEVCDYIVEKMSGVFSSANITYVKWDMNRIFTDAYSKSLDPSRQGEVRHRYVLGLYRIMGELVRAFPDILFEGCASGGNRFDLGILSYFPQIWASDNTDALCRAQIQHGYSYGYPQSVVSAHISNCPNHQTLRSTPIETRFGVAAFGLLGYELNLCEISSDDAVKIKKQIELYKQFRQTFQFGKFYRSDSANIAAEYSIDRFGLSESQNIMQLTVVSEDAKEAVSGIIQDRSVANKKDLWIQIPGLDDDTLYNLANVKFESNIMDFGDLVNQATPFHVRQNSLIHRAISRFVKLPSETEEYTAYGSSLKNAGMKTAQGFSGTGFSEEVRHFPDYSGRLYLVRADEETDSNN